ncbi:IS5 family transposase [Larkinella insperata]|uniref:IS5 family transposase n=1 Tax=Larkinella insperata TaxID=332158 RepID=A0ABW3QC10_9BACT|nr:IS5 family transposase [Larkinella insperata]
MRRYEITDQQWYRLAPLLPGKPGDVGRTATDNRLFINAILWIARSGAPWRDLPRRFGMWNSVYRRFRRWTKAGVWKKISESCQDPELEWLMTYLMNIQIHEDSDELQAPS